MIPINRRKFIELGLKGKVAQVTGAGSQIGFGRAIAVALAKEGCGVIVNDLYLEGAEQTAAEIEKPGQQAMAIQADVTKGDEWDKMVTAAMAKFGHIDILVNNTGGCTPPKPFLKITDKDWEFDIAVNPTSTCNGTRALLPHMIERKSGKIANVTSGAGIHGGMFTAGYAAAKAGIIAFSKCIAKESVADGINVNCVSPDIADTGFTKNAPSGLLENSVKTIPLRRLTTPEDITNSVIFLVSGVASDMIGQVLIVIGDVNPRG
jgi:NAD(P)-dependent dehydrogenase (short-subunit alcohol dehydrogenase family)